MRTNSSERRLAGKVVARRQLRFRHTALYVSVLIASVLILAPVEANNDLLYLDCPCEVSSDGASLTITAGVRSFRSTDSNALYFRVVARVHGGAREVTIAEVAVTDSLSAGASVAIDSHSTRIESNAMTINEAELELRLEERRSQSSSRLDQVRMMQPVDLSGEFAVDNLDYLRDADGDGVGDLNESLQRTDPADLDSVPGDSTIDVLALYSQSFPDLFDGDPTTRIQHLFALANDIFARSEVHLRFRLVGMVQIHVDESNGNSPVDRAVWNTETERHGTDLVVQFRPQTPTSPCGFAGIGAWRKRGHFNFKSERNNFAMVFGNCNAPTLAHELGHVMGLGHSFWQGSTGTWRWSRGHGVDNDFGTIMTYGPQVGEGPRIHAFSNPLSLCTGALEVETPCGVDGEDVKGADAVTTLNAVRFRIAAFRESLPDSDEDGFVDSVDALPNDPDDWWDADEDGVGDNADTDDDNDGVIDIEDAFPFDGTETTDSDGDGVGDNADAFPADSRESVDTDGDGVGDNADVFPTDPLESVDTDSDGVGDNGDPWPDNPLESVDTDGDGVGDNADPDADDDGVADEFDAFPLDADKTDLASYQLLGEGVGDQAGEILSMAGPSDRPSIVIGVPQNDAGGMSNAGAVYLVSASDLGPLDAADGRVDRVVALERVATGSRSWKFVGEQAHDSAGRSLATVGDADGDGEIDILVGAPYHSSADAGAAYYISGADFIAADSADGASDHTIQLAHVAAQPGSWKLVGESNRDEFGIGVALVPDTDGDGSAEILVGAWNHDPGERQRAGSAYLLASGDLTSTDAADGAADGVINVRHASSQANSWKIIGESVGDHMGAPLTALSNIGGGGTVEFAINAQFRRVDGARYPGASYLASISDLVAADEADGQSDRIVDAAHIADQPTSWKISNGRSQRGIWADKPIASLAGTDGSIGWIVAGSDLLSVRNLTTIDAADGLADGILDMTQVVGQPDSWRFGVHQLTPVGDTDGDGVPDLVGVFHGHRGATAYLFSPTQLAGADTVNDGPDGEIWDSELENMTGAWTILESRKFRLPGVSIAGDVDRDGLVDLLLGYPGESTDRLPGSVYLVLAADLAALDRVDSIINRRLNLQDLAGDTDADGLLDTTDRDDDGDGVPDWADAFQLDPDEWADTDSDGVGDNADALPLDRTEQFDTDADGLGDRSDDDDDGDGITDGNDRYPLDTDNDGTENRDDDDDDNDGVSDVFDAFPLDSSESGDTDGDGIGNNADTDDDGDGVPDVDDVFPLDPREHVDSDNDGVGDNADAFPRDPSESLDRDGDGVGDNADDDDDNDGILDADDRYPLDPEASNDSDGDDVEDSIDAFPNDADEWADSDSDGIGDNADDDDDGDGVDDDLDLFPLDGSRSDLMSVKLPLRLTDRYFLPSVASAGDLDGDGRPELLIRAPGTDENTAAYVVSPSDLSTGDEADGIRDGTIHLQNVPPQFRSWKIEGRTGAFTGERMSSLGDIDANGTVEFYLGTDGSLGGGVIISAASLSTVDALDGTVDGVLRHNWLSSQPGSWRVAGPQNGGRARTTPAADLQGDHMLEVVFGQPGRGRGDSPGAVHVYSASDFTAIKSVCGAILMYCDQGLWHLIGERPGDGAGTGVLMTDFDGDHRPDLIVSAPDNNTNLLGEGAVYLLGNQDFSTADQADGATDGRIELGRIAAEPHSWKIVGNVEDIGLGRDVLTGDVDGDGRPDIILSSRDSARRLSILSGAVGNLVALDQADGATDGTIALTNFGSGLNRHVMATAVSSLSSLDTADFDGDGRDDLLIGLWPDSSSAPIAHLISASLVFDHDLDFTANAPGFSQRIRSSGSYVIYALEATASDSRVAIAAAGDVDADGLGDVLLAVNNFSISGHGTLLGAVYLIVAADLPHLDAADGNPDGYIFLSNVTRERR